MFGNDPTVGSSHSLAERFFVYPKLEPNHDMLNPPINQESDFHFLQEPAIFSNALWSAPRHRSFGYGPRTPDLCLSQLTTHTPQPTQKG